MSQSQILLINIMYFYSNKDEITLSKLSGAKVFVIGGPREKFTSPEVRLKAG